MRREPSRFTGTPVLLIHSPSMVNSLITGRWYELAEVPHRNGDSVVGVRCKGACDDGVDAMKSYLLEVLSLCVS